MVNEGTDGVSKEEELYHYKGEYEVKLSPDIYLELAKLPEIESLNTGLPTVDRLVGGVVPGELILISGWTGGGKTTLARTFTRNFSRNNIMSCWFQFEETHQQFFRKFGTENIQAIPIFSLPKKNKPESMEWFEERVYESILKYGTKIIFIDHLHRLLDAGLRGNAILKSGGSNVSTFVGANVMNIKRIAIHYNVVICMIAHTTKPQPANSKDVLGLGSVRDSSFIEQESDTVLYVWRSEEHENGGNLKIAKDRKNGTANRIIKMIHDPISKMFGEFEGGYDD